jgi:hypothetical protein
MRTRQNLAALSEGRLSSFDGRSSRRRSERKAAIRCGATITSASAILTEATATGCEGRLETAEGMIPFSAPPARKAGFAGTPGGNDCRQQGAVSIRDPPTPEGSHRGAGGLGRRVPGARLSVRDIEDALPGPRQGRDRSPAAVQDGGLGDRGAAVGCLPGVLPARSRRVPVNPPLRPRHRRAHPAGTEARVGAGGPVEAAWPRRPFQGWIARPAGARWGSPRMARRCSWACLQGLSLSFSGIDCQEAIDPISEGAGACWRRRRDRRPLGLSRRAPRKMPRRSWRSSRTCAPRFPRKRTSEIHSWPSVMAQPASSRWIVSHGVV